MHNIRPVQAEDVKAIVSQAGQAALEALRVLGVADIESAVHTLVRSSSLTRTIEHQGSPIAVFGFVPTSATGSSVWLIAIDNLSALPPSLIVQAKDYLQEVAKDFPKLTTAVWEKNPDHIRWVQWLGFQETSRAHINGEVFLNFVREENHGI